jgi:C-terminus of AA_permease
MGRIPIDYTCTNHERIKFSFNLIIKKLFKESCLKNVYKAEHILSVSVPWLPAASILTNVFLMTKLSLHTWIRFSVWMGVGFLIYGIYGWRNSSGTEGSQ